jgi:hypothetical protein
MTHRRSRRWLWIVGSIVVILVIGGFFGVKALEGEVLEHSQRILTTLSGPGSSVSFDRVDIDPLRGNVQWSGIRITQPAAEPDSAMGDRSMRISGQVEAITVRGLSLWRLVFSKTLSVRSIAVVRPSIEVILMNDSGTAAQLGAMELSSLNADSLLLEGAVFRMHRTGDSAELRVDTLNLQIEELRGQWGRNKPFELRFASVQGQLLGIQATLPPLYDLHVAAVSLGDGGRTLEVTDARFKPRRGPQQYDKVVHFEVDLFDAHLDTVRMNGLDLGRFIEDRTLNLNTLRIAGADVNVYRDKTMPDEPYKEKPMPARALRELPLPICMDSLLVERWQVHYSEKNTLTPDFGQVEFSEINGVVTGLCTLDSASTDTVFLRATAKAYDEADIAVEVETVVGDTNDIFILRANIQGFRFSEFNRMTEDLVLARATSGTIGGVDFTMRAGLERAVGRVDMEYDNMKIELLKKDLSGKPRKFVSAVANMLVHKRNLRSDPDFRHGDFTVDRLKDRSIFKYVWMALREGMIVSVLPGFADDLRQAQQAAKAN